MLAFCAAKDTAGPALHLLGGHPRDPRLRAFGSTPHTLRGPPVLAGTARRRSVRDPATPVAFGLPAVMNVRTFPHLASWSARIVLAVGSPRAGQSPPSDGR